MEEDISIARACKIMDIHRSFYYYQSRKDDSDVEDAIRKYARDGEGFDKMLQRMQKDGCEWSRNKVRRVYLKLHFNKRVRLKKRVPAREKHPLRQSEGPNLMWSMDFLSDACESGRKFRVLNIIDDFNREAVADGTSELDTGREACPLCRACDIGAWKAEEDQDRQRPGVHLQGL